MGQVEAQWPGGAPGCRARALDGPDVAHGDDVEVARVMQWRGAGPRGAAVVRHIDELRQPGREKGGREQAIARGEEDGRRERGVVAPVGGR